MNPKQPMFSVDILEAEVHHMKAITALGVGTLIGATVVILFAPKSGKEMLADLTDRVNDSIERGTAKAREIARQTNEVAAMLKDQVQSVQGAVDAGVRAFKEATNSSSHRPS
jgi:gas vesicle protein